MKHAIRKFKTLALALKELEPFVRDGRHLQSGRPFHQLGGMRSREAIANWLLCVAANFSLGSERLIFTSDPTGGDGIIWDREQDEGWPTEHVMVPNIPGKTEAIDVRILAAVADKHALGATYAKGKTLIVFLDAPGGPWYPNRVAHQLPAPLLFEAVWVVSLFGVEDKCYTYAVTRLDTVHAPAWRVRIAEDFTAWLVTPIQ